MATPDRIELETRIKASRGVVWQALTDFRAYRQWNPFLWNALGEARVGGRLFVQMQPPGANPLRFQARVERFDIERELRWSTRFVAARLFRAEYTFRLEPGHGRRDTRLLQSAQFAGALAGFVPRIQYRRQREGLEQMAAALASTFTERSVDSGDSESDPAGPENEAGGGDGLAGLTLRLVP